MSKRYNSYENRKYYPLCLLTTLVLCGTIFVVEQKEMIEEAAMLDAAIAIRIHPARAGAARRAIIVLRWPAWPKIGLLDAHRREQRGNTLDRALNASRNAALLNLPVVKGF